MFTKKMIFRMFSIFLVVLMISGTASASPLNAALGTGFTYQGKLSDAGAPANGTYDFEFKLYNALSGGSQVGSTVTKGDVVVTNGLFTVQLDFGNVFDGTALYLEIGVRPGISTGAYTALVPRQPLSATPYALYAAKAPWSGLSGMPAGFADGVDNGSSYQNVKIVAKSGGDFTTITAALGSISGASDSNRFLVWVAPGVYNERVTMKPFVDIEGAGELTTKITFSGSAAADTGTVLGANNAELRFLTAENTGGNTWAIAINNYGSSPRLTHVTVTASGGTGGNRGIDNEQSAAILTNVTASASGAGNSNYGVYNHYNLNGLSSPTLTDVTASASGGATNIGVYNDITTFVTMTNVTASASGGTENRGVSNYSSKSTMTNVTASASGGTTNIGIHNQSNAAPTMTNVIASASGGTNSFGVYNLSSSSPTMTNVTASASGGTNSFGVYNLSSSSPTMTNVTASALGGTMFSIGVYNLSSSPTMTNVTATALGGGSSSNFGVYNDSSTPTINNSAISGSGGITNNYGIYNTAASSTYTVRVNNSQISGVTNTIRNDTEFTILIGASQLNGGAVTGGGTLTCAGVYDEAYTIIYTGSCP